MLEGIEEKHRTICNRIQYDEHRIKTPRTRMHSLDANLRTELLLHGFALDRCVAKGSKAFIDKNCIAEKFTNVARLQRQDGHTVADEGVHMLSS